MNESRGSALMNALPETPSRERLLHFLTLCRCGASQSKPFCDGSHSRVGFKSSS